jgi:hypothetical protein
MERRAEAIRLNSRSCYRFPKYLLGGGIDGCVH